MGWEAIVAHTFGFGVGQAFHGPGFEQAVRDCASEVGTGHRWEAGAQKANQVVDALRCHSAAPP